MLKTLFRRNQSNSRGLAVPVGQRIYAIGDIHGRADLLDQLLDMIDGDIAKRGEAHNHVILMGDLVDRGPDSRAVIERAMTLSSRYDKASFLMGNHEEVMLGASTGDPKMVRFFNRIGGRETILSYGLPEKQYRELDLEELAETLSELFPAEHIVFLSDFQDQIIIGDYVFVHAGVRPDVPLSEQSAKDMRWIREDFIGDKRRHEKFVIHGHTISDSVDQQRNRIGIDTGAYITDQLTAIGLEGGERWFLQTSSAE
ncbi:metallophosphoesterase family protein [Alterisphingorhabdus coralli]|uniref:Metallophosphoesterase family protein n=1 Tax=Alterisphingorhabdus coralli TaxID=3071408 RepID=A0AA97F7R8_9SPHN|nr:metallophosphoesterase family protein [Parasphingorhabdus sp. SCSIO 66989]WOE75939.1 metallophosphoesterase family protein [Parasphingorhabdus sp. SCSIO 66989]